MRPPWEAMRRSLLTTAWLSKVTSLMKYSNFSGPSIMIIWKHRNSLSTVNYFCNIGCAGHVSGMLVPGDAVCMSVLFQNYPESERFTCCTNSVSEQKCDSPDIKFQAVTASIIIFASWLYHCPKLHPIPQKYNVCYLVQSYPVFPKSCRNKQLINSFLQGLPYVYSTSVLMAFLSSSVFPFTVSFLQFSDYKHFAAIHV